MRLLAAGPVLLLSLVFGQTQLRSLKAVPIPEPAGLSEYVRYRAALVRLGKVFFWDMQAGSDGVAACATCHFHVRADHRQQNQVVDLNRAFPENLDLGSLAFLFYLLNDPGNRDSGVVLDSSVRIGSAGTDWISRSSCGMSCRCVA
jgi:ferredoxin